MWPSANGVARDSLWYSVSKRSLQSTREGGGAALPHGYPFSTDNAQACRVRASELQYRQLARR
jgi:hypothetical protein